MEFLKMKEWAERIREDYVYIAETDHLPMADIPNRAPPKLNVALQLGIGGSRSRQPFLLVRPGKKGFPGDVLLRVDGAVERRLIGRRSGRLRLADADGSAPAASGTLVRSADPVGDELLLVSGDEVRLVRFRR